MRARSTCLGDLLPEYVAGRLDPSSRLHWDRHLVVCLTCQHAAADEQRLQATLAHQLPAPPERLRLQLLALATLEAAQQAGPAAPPVPAAPSVAAALPLIHPGAPPVHRSPLRAAVVTVAVVGASAAAALTLAGTGAPGPGVTAVVHGGRPALSSGSPSTDPPLGAALVEQAGFGAQRTSSSPSASATGASGAPSAGWTTGSSGTVSDGRAESTP